MKKMFLRFYTIADEEYIQAYKDYGWEYFNACMGWNYFRKPAAEVKEVNDGEIFSALIALLFVLDAYICVHCSAKLRK